GPPVAVELLEAGDQGGKWLHSTAVDLDDGEELQGLGGVLLEAFGGVQPGGPRAAVGHSVVGEGASDDDHGATRRRERHSWFERCLRFAAYHSHWIRTLATSGGANPSTPSMAMRPGPGYISEWACPLHPVSGMA